MSEKTTIDWSSQGMDTIQYLLFVLPSTVNYAGKSFYFQLIHNENHLRLVYILSGLNSTDIWFNPFTKTNCSFLLLIEDIEDQLDLLSAINEARIFLLKNNLIQWKSH